VILCYFNEHFIPPDRQQHAVDIGSTVTTRHLQAVMLSCHFGEEIFHGGMFGAGILGVLIGEEISGGW